MNLCLALSSASTFLVVFAYSTWWIIHPAWLGDHLPGNAADVVAAACLAMKISAVLAPIVCFASIFTW